MSAWSAKPCRACLAEGLACEMYDLDVPETFELYTSSANIGVSLDVSASVPQHICSMCYRLCELIQGFKERCVQSEKKFARVTNSKKRSLPKASKPVSSAPRARPMKLEKEQEHQFEEVVESEMDSFIPGNTHWEDADDAIETDQDWYSEEPSTKKKKKKIKVKGAPKPEPVPPKAMNPYELSMLEWERGPSKNGVWNHFERDTTKNYTRCMEEGCGKIILQRCSQTSSMRKHLERNHKIELPNLGRYGHERFKKIKLNSTADESGHEITIGGDDDYENQDHNVSDQIEQCEQ